ncbi:HAD-IIB family hydrolase [Enterococcus sp. LJL128]|uniref:HAD-IIB family hydrolase n=1 Tax=Enterococcus sp. LJL51 TaxID=3416656 RepID=UPI003CF34BBE
MKQKQGFKVLVCDMDGTLTYEESESSTYTPSKKGLPVRNHEQITQFIDDGGFFCVATGRLAADVQGVIGAELFGRSYKIVQNGSFTIDPEGNILGQDQFSKEQSDRIYQKLRALQLPFACSVADQHTYEAEIALELMESVFGDVVEKVQVSEQAAHPENPANICIVREDNQALRQDLLKLQKALADEAVNFQITSPYTIDINPVSVNKGAAVKKLVEQLAVPIQQVAVVGDSYNDISMFKVFPESYVMSHAEAPVKKQAKYQVAMVADVFEGER